MHTFECQKTRWHFNSDLSGVVVITNSDGQAVDIPGDDLRLFIAQWNRRQAEYEIERLTDLA